MLHDLHLLISCELRMFRLKELNLRTQFTCELLVHGSI